MGIEVLSPDVNESNYLFSVNHKGDIRFGLGAIKGFNRSAANAIVEERLANGPYKDIYDFFERSSPSVLTNKTCEALVLTGAFDSLGSFKREGYIADDANLPDNFLTRLLKITASAISRCCQLAKLTL